VCGGKEERKERGDGDDDASTKEGGNEETHSLLLFFSTPSSSFQQLPEGRTADEAIQELNAAHAAYRRVEASLQAKRTRLLAKLPEISRARAAVAALRESLGEDENEEEETAKSPPIDLDFCVAEQVYSRATLDRRRLREGGVALWLGAGVSVEYKLPEAQALLEANESAAKSNIRTNGEDLDFVRDCITTTQVSISRVYNWDMASKGGGGGGGGGGAGLKKKAVAV